MDINSTRYARINCVEELRYLVVHPPLVTTFSMKIHKCTLPLKSPGFFFRVFLQSAIIYAHVIPGEIIIIRFQPATPDTIYRSFAILSPATVTARISRSTLPTRGVATVQSVCSFFFFFFSIFQRYTIRSLTSLFARDIRITTIRVHYSPLITSTGTCTPKRSWRFNSRSGTEWVIQETARTVTS